MSNIVEFTPGKLYMLSDDPKRFPYWLRSPLERLSSLAILEECPTLEWSTHKVLHFTTKEKEILLDQRVPLMFLNLHVIGTWTLDYNDNRLYYLEFLMFHKKCFISSFNIRGCDGLSSPGPITNPRLIDHIP